MINSVSFINVAFLLIGSLPAINAVEDSGFRYESDDLGKLAETS